MAERDNEFGAFMVGFVIGGLVGAAVALLTAPQSGEETRTLIRDKSIELKDKAAETAEETRLRAEKTATEARTRADELSKEARDRADQIRTRGQEILEDQRKRIETGREKIGSAVDAGVKAAKTRRDQLTGDSKDK